MLEVKNLTKVYKPKKGEPVTALDDVSLKFPETGLIFILGKSGSGKSTLLNIMGGLDKADSGEIIIKDKSSKDFSQADFDSYRNTYLGFIFQEYNILNEFNVGQNIALAIELQGRKATDEQINEILQEVDLADFAKRKPNEMSGGQKQRIAIARALVKNPDIIMADEPTGALDSRTGIQVFDTLKKLSKKKLVIVVSHDREFAESYGDRVIEFKDGKVISDIEKYTAQAEKKSESVSIIDNKIISIKKGYTLTKEDVALINDYLQNNNAIISIDETSNRDLKKFARIDDSDNKECFKNTDESTIKRTDQSEFKLIKSKLPFKASFKMGASGLKSKPARLVFTIILAVVAFTMFGFVDTISAYNKITTTTNSLYDSKEVSLAYSKEKRIDADDYSYYNESLLKDEDIQLINQQVGISAKPVLSNDYNGLNQIFTENAAIKGTSYNSSYKAQTYGLMDYYDSFISDTGFTFVAGREPHNNNEIAISKYTYEAYAKLGFRDALNNISDEDMQRKTPNEFLNLNPKISSSKGGEFTIVGIIDTGFDREHFASLDNPGDGGFFASMLLMELENCLRYGYAGMVYTNKGYVEGLVNELKNGTNAQKFQNAGINYTYNGNYQNISSAYDIANVKIAGDNTITNQDVFVQYFDGVASLGEYDLVVYLYTYLNLVNYFNDLTEDELPEWVKKYNNRWEYQSNWRNEQIEEYLKPYVEEFKNSGVKAGYYTTIDNVLVWWEYDSYYDEYGQIVKPDTPTDWNNYSNEEIKNMFMNYLYFLNETEGEDYHQAGISINQKDYNNYQDELWSKYDESLFYKDVMFECFKNGSIKQGMNILTSETGNIWGSTYIDGISFRICGVYYSPTMQNGEQPAVISSSCYSKLVDKESGYYTCAIAPMFKDKNLINNAVVFANKENNTGVDGYRFNMQNGVCYLLNSVDSLLTDFSQIFLWVGVGLAVFAALMLLNYISTSISYKKREIGILRAVGARASDVFSIFFNEATIIALINFVFAIFATFGVVMYLNSYIAKEYMLNITFLNFSIRQVLLMLAISLATAFVSSFGPVYAIAKKKPVDAIRSV